MSQSSGRSGFRVALAAAVCAAGALFPLGIAEAAGTDGVIAYTRFVPLPHNGTVRSIDPATGAQSWLAAGSTPAWSPDGRRLAFIGTTGKVRIRNADGSVTATGVPASG